MCRWGQMFGHRWHASCRHCNRPSASILPVQRDAVAAAAAAATIALIAALIIETDRMS